MFSGTLKYDSINLLTGPAQDYTTNATVSNEGEATVLAKSEDGLMMFVQVGADSGWVHLSNMTVKGDTAELPVWTNPMDNASRVSQAE